MCAECLIRKEVIMSGTTKQFLDANGLKRLWVRIKQTFAPISIFTPTTITFAKKNLDGGTITVTKLQAANNGSYPRLLMLDGDGEELTPEKIVRTGEQDTIVITLTQKQIEILEEGKKIRVILIQ